MNIVFKNTPLIRVSDITVSSDSDDFIVLAYMSTKFNNKRFTHHLHADTYGRLSFAVYTNHVGEKEVSGRIDSEDFCKRLEIELIKLTSNLTPVAKSVMSHVWDMVAYQELSENLAMSEEVTKLYTEYLMEYK